MNAGIVRAETIAPVINGVLKVTRLLPDGFPFSVALIELNGSNDTVKNKICFAAYYILTGNGRFTIDGNESEVSQGNLVFIPRGHIYHDESESPMTMLNICFPKFDPKQVEKQNK
jgi:mannose-6-phosphate isomerase-like protein (cupin superfamily)